MNKKVLVLGAGLAGCEVASLLAKHHIQVVLVDGKKHQRTKAQSLDTYSELVCTNSLKSLKETSGHGMLKREMQQLGSLVLECAYENRVPAGDALAVDVENFSKMITEKLHANPNIEIIDRVVDDPFLLKEEFACDYVVVATGPLPVGNIDNWMKEYIGKQDHYFYDAIAPIVDADSLDTTKMYLKDRHKEFSGEADYLNVPLSKKEYINFIKELESAEKTATKDFENYKFFEGCLPIDVMAERNVDAARYSCLKPIGLEYPDNVTRNGYLRPYGVVQLRKENLLGDAYNLVGLQTRLTRKEQLRVFKMLPGLENASFLRLGSVHRNSYINARKCLDWDLSSKKNNKLYFAGQITGVEGYTESAASGLYVAIQIIRTIGGKSTLNFPKETCIGALINYIMTAPKASPSGINFGLLPSIEVPKTINGVRLKDKKGYKREHVSKRAKEIMDRFMIELEI